MTVPISAEQKAAIDASPGEPVRLVDDRTGTAYVLLTLEHYQHLKRWLEPLTRDCWDDPLLDEYNNYEENLRKLRGESR